MQPLSFAGSTTKAISFLGRQRPAHQRHSLPGVGARRHAVQAARPTCMQQAAAGQGCRTGPRAIRLMTNSLKSAERKNRRATGARNKRGKNATRQRNPKPTLHARRGHAGGRSQGRSLSSTPGPCTGSSEEGGSVGRCPVLPSELLPSVLQKQNQIG